MAGYTRQNSTEETSGGTLPHGTSPGSIGKHWQ